MYSDTSENADVTSVAVTTTTASIPRRLLVVPAVIFVMVTSEFMLSPLLPQIARALDRPLGQTSLLITALAVGQVVGGVTLGVLLSRIRPALALAGLALAFAAVHATPIFTASWPAVLGTRALAGFLMASMFTVALTAAGAIVPPALTARASGVVFSGVTFGLTVGSPIAGWLGGIAGWRWAFGAVSIGGILTAIAVLAVFRAPVPPRPDSTAETPGRALHNPRLWATYLTALLLVGGAAASYTFFGALLERETGWGPTAISVVLLVYGGASIVGNLAIARHSAQRPDRTLAIVGGTAAALYAIAAIGSGSVPVLVLAIVLLGLVGFTVNPSIISLVVQHSGNRAITNALAATSVTLGIVIGSAAAGALVDHGLGLQAPLVMSAVVSVLAILAVRFARPTVVADPEPDSPLGADPSDESLKACCS